MHECTCRICGKTFYAKNKRQVLCSKECRTIANRERVNEYRQKHRAEVIKYNRLRRERQRREAKKKPDTIVAIGYAERQMAKSLEMAGKINTELERSYKHE